MLRLSGKEGSLDLFIVYFHTGVQAFPQDVIDAGLNSQGRHLAQASHLPENPAARPDVNVPDGRLQLRHGSRRQKMLEFHGGHRRQGHA